MTHLDPDRPTADAPELQLDELLRQALDPAPGTAERIARRALEARPESHGAPARRGRPWRGRPWRRQPWRRRPWLRHAVVTVALLALVAGAWLTIPRLVPYLVPDLVSQTTHTVAIHPGVDTEAPGSQESPAPSRLSISNVGGTVTVTTADGTRWIALPRDEPVRNGG